MIKILARYDDKVTNLILENAKKKMTSMPP